MLGVSMLFVLLGRCRAGIVLSSQSRMKTLRTREVIMLVVMNAEWRGRVAVHALRGRLGATGDDFIARVRLRLGCDSFRLASSAAKRPVWFK